MLVPTRPKLGAAVVLAAVIWSGLPDARADDVQRQGDLPQACPLCRQYQKGCPQNIAWYAQPSNTPRYIGYYVGGGALVNESKARFADEGTWGWDYSPLLIKSRVRLGWWHGEHAQGGTGSYRTDGPRLVQPH
jgi:hypothetical protein